MFRHCALSALALAIAGCAFGASTARLDARASLAGFGHDVPRAPGWRVDDESTAQMRSLRYRLEAVPAEDRSYQFELQVFVPARPVATQEDVLEWARAGGDRRTVERADGHGAVCARYAYRWTQRMSLDGAALRETHEIDDRGLFCVHPSGDGRLLHARAMERSALGFPTGTFAPHAERLLESVRWEGSTPAVPR